MDIPSNLLEQISDVKELEISYRMLHDSAYLNDESTNSTIEIPFYSLIDKYKDILNDIVITVNLDDRLSRQYLFNPKLLSYHLYGTVELWSEILRLNNLAFISEFKPVQVKIYDPNKLKPFLNEILILESKV